MAEPAKPPDEGEDDSLRGSLPAGMVPVVNRSGGLTHVREHDWPRLKAQGYRFQTPEEQDKYNARLRYGGTVGELKAGAAGVARGLTLGLSDLAMTGLGASRPETLKGLEEENPVASGAGELAGAVLPEFIPGVGEVTAPRLAAKAGKLVSRGLGLAEEAKTGVKLGEEALKAARLMESEGAVGAAHTLRQAAELGSEAEKLPMGKRLLGKVVAGAVEGGLFGVGSTVSEYALGEPDLNAQKIVGNVGLGAILGGAGGGLGGLLDEAAGPALERTAKSLEDVEGALTGVSRRQANKAMGFIQSDLNRSLRDPRTQAEMADMLMTRGHISGTATENLASVQRDLAETGKALGRELGVPELEAGTIHSGLLGGEKSEAEAAIKKALEGHWEREAAVMKAADAGGHVPNYQDAAAQLGRLYDQQNPAARRLMRPWLEGALEDLAVAEKEGLGFQKLNEIKTTLARSAWAGGDSETTALKKAIASTIKDSIDGQLEKVVGGELAKEFQDAKRVYGILKAGSDVIGNAKSRGADAINAMVERAGLQSETARNFRLLSIAEDAGIRGANRAAGNKFYGLTDQLKGLLGGTIGVGVGGPMGALAGNVIGQQVSHSLEQRGPAMVAHIAKWIRDTPAAMAIANHFGHALGKVTANLGEFGPHIVSAFASSPSRGLAEHIMLARDNPEYRRRLEAVGFNTPDRVETMQALDKVRAMESTRLALEEQDRKTDRQVQHIIRGGAEPHVGAVKTRDLGARRTTSKDAHERHEKQVADIMRLASNPQAFADRVAKNTEGLSEHAPATAAALVATSQRAVQYLSQKAAKPPPSGPLGQPYRPSGEEVASFSRHLEAVQKPQSVLRHAATGTLTQEHVEALKTVYPKLYQHMVSKVMDRLTDRPRVPYRSRVMLSLLTGQDLDGTLSSTAIAANQHTIKSPSSRPDNEAKPRAAGADKLTMGSRLRTPQQAVEERKA